MTPDRLTSPLLSQTLVMGETRVDEPRKAATNDTACLIFIAGERIGRKLDLSEKELVVGRDPRCGLMINSELVSRNHSRLTNIGDTTVIVDLDSTNGTFVNDERIRERILRDGDRIAIGKVVVKYLGRGSAEVGYHDEVYRLVSHDGLTDAYNKRFFDEHLASECRGKRSDVSVIIFDADHFKAVNDTHGHAAGDAVLCQLAACAKSCVPDGSFLARIGGEEFALLMPGAKFDEAKSTADAIRRTVDEQVFSFGDVTIPVTVSVGVAHAAPGGKVDGVELFKRADEQLYLAKQRGRNRVCG